MGYYGNLPKVENIKKIMLTIEIKMLDDDRERKKEYMKNYYYKKI